MKYCFIFAVVIVFHSIKAVYGNETENARKTDPTTTEKPINTKNRTKLRSMKSRNETLKVKPDTESKIQDNKNTKFNIRTGADPILDEEDHHLLNHDNNVYEEDDSYLDYEGYQSYGNGSFGGSNSTNTTDNSTINVADSPSNVTDSPSEVIDSTDEVSNSPDSVSDSPNTTSKVPASNSEVSVSKMTPVPDVMIFDLEGMVVTPASELIQMYQLEIVAACKNVQVAIQAHNSDVFDSNLGHIMAEQMSHFDKIKGKYWKAVKQERLADRKHDSNSVIFKQLEIISKDVGFGTLPHPQNLAMQNVRLYLEENYRARFVPEMSKNESSVYYSKIEDILRFVNSTYTEKQYYWLQWYNRTDNLSINMDIIVNQFITVAAKKQDLLDGSELMIKSLECPDLTADIDRIWEAVKPIYTLLRKHVIKELKDKYKEEYTHEGPLFPAHLTGSLGGSDWTHWYEDVMPYPCETSFQTITNFLEYCNITQAYRRSMGIVNETIDCNTLFNVKTSMFASADCRPRAHDFCDGISYTTYVCDNRPVGFDFGKEFEKMLYSMQYYKQPYLLRGANPVIQDAITSLLTTQVYRFGLNNHPNEESSINQLMYEALYFLPKIAYAMTLTKFRWEKVKNELPQDRWSSFWWQLRETYEGVEPPIDFQHGEYDPAANYDVVMGIDKTSDILSPFILFQTLHTFCDSHQNKFQSEIQKRKCEKASLKSKNTERNLYQCSLYGRKDIGAWIQHIQSQGKLMDYDSMLMDLTGRDNIDIKFFLQYFKPLTDYLRRNTPPSSADQSEYGYILWIGIAIMVVILIIIVIMCIRKSRRRNTKKLSTATVTDIGPQMNV